MSTPTTTDIQTLQQTEQLIKYAAQTVNDAEKRKSLIQVIGDIQDCRFANDEGQWTSAIATKFWTAYNSLCTLISPVNTDTLITTGTEIPSRFWFSRNSTTTAPKKAVNRYICGFLGILIASIALTFVTSSLTSLSSEVARIIGVTDPIADETVKNLAVLRAKGVAGDQEFPSLKDVDSQSAAGKVSSLLPSLYANADKLQSKAANAALFVKMQYPDCKWPETPDKYFCYARGEGGGIAKTIDDAQANVDNYRLASRRATYITEQTLQIANAINQTILPLLLGMVGACAYIIRMVSDQIRTFSYSSTSGIRNFVRLTLGALAGVAIGFGGLFTGSTLSAVALSFLAGYSIEPVFATFDSIANKLK